MDKSKSIQSAFEYATLVELLRGRAHFQAQTPGYAFLTDTNTGEMQMTYNELDSRARIIGALLQSEGAAGQRVLLLYPPGAGYLEAFFGCLYAGAIAVPAYPPHPRRPMPRLQALVSDSQAQFMLTTTQILADMQQRLTHLPDLAALQWIATDVLPASLADQWQEPKISQESLAFLQYTSGSVGLPKGVMLSHRNLLHNSALIYQTFGNSASTVGVSWLPPYHDMGLIGTILQSLYGGFPLTLMSPAYFLQQPLRWLQAISHKRATASGGPNFAYDLCVRTVTPEQKAELDLSCWELAFNGAEPVRIETMERFANAFACCGFRREAFYPCYGLAEATLLVSGHTKLTPPVVQTFSAQALEQHRACKADVDETETRTLVGYQKEIATQQTLVVHPSSRIPCHDGEVGEIWVTGSSVACGYWKRPEETALTFGAHLATTHEGPFLRTGDLGFVYQNSLFITGRLKDLIIIRGRNHYPQDIEMTAEQAHCALRAGCGAVFAVDIAGVERLVVAYEVERQYRNVDCEEVARAVRKAVAEQHELQIYALCLVRPGAIPKTSSGKIQRHACKAQFLDGSLSLMGESTVEIIEHTLQQETDRDEVLSFKTASRLERPERLLALICQQVASVLSIERRHIDPGQPVSALGLDSLMALELKSSIETSLGIQIPVATFFQDESLEQLSAHILTLFEASNDTPQARVEHKENIAEETPLPLAAGQQALWFLQQLEPENTAYTIAQAATLYGALDREALQRALQVLVDRHPALRTNFVAQNGQGFQIIHAQREVFFHVEDGCVWSDEQVKATLSAYANCPFDLEHGPLLRVSLVKRADEEHILLLTIHHLIADLWSLTIFVKELSLFYTAERAGQHLSLPLPRWQYPDYVTWQQEMLASQQGHELQEFWRKYLAGDLAPLELPTDHRRPPVQTYHGAAQAFLLDQTLTAQLRVLANAHGVTLYTLLLSAFQVLLHRYTGQRDILVGSPSTGRGRSETEGMIGYFVQPIVQRAQVSGDQTFSVFLHEARQRVLDVLAHQEYPFPLLVEQLAPRRDPSRTPLFQVMFAFQKTHQVQALSAFVLAETSTHFEMGNINVVPLPLEQQTAKFDLTLEMVEGEIDLPGRFEYNRDLFEKETLQRLVQGWQRLLTALVADPERSIHEFPVIGEAEEEVLVDSLHGVMLPDIGKMCLHQLFEEQAKRTPQAIAIYDGYEALTYTRLNQEANRLAHYLQKQGVGPETLVGICQPRTYRLLLSILAVLKAGGAYVPLDPAYPQERISAVLEDAGIQMLLTQQQLLSRFVGQPFHCIVVDSDALVLATESTLENIISPVQPSHLAYVIYTSGSTGRPKGVAITHGSAVKLVQWAQTIYNQAECAVVLASTSICFDLSVYELFFPLSCGGKVVMVENALSLLDNLWQEPITLINTVPSALSELLKRHCIPETVRVINVAGEVLQRELATSAYHNSQIARLYNLYGPSEDTTYSTYALIERDSMSSPSIGGPIANTQVCILDEYLKRVPTGVTGEIYLGGEGLARGYLHRPDLTAERFIPHPFSQEPGARLYKTGDLGRYRPDGQIEFGGRRDFQIKLHGYRIELGEIEVHLAQHPSVQKGVVHVSEDTMGEKCLVAYIEVRSETIPTVDELRIFLKERLPGYMVPAAFVFLTALPLAPNGKIDRRALPVPDWNGSSAEVVAPCTPIEEVLVSIWSEVLEIERAQISTHANFFEMGGHSLVAVQVQARMERDLLVHVPLQVFFEQSTIADLAVWVKNADQGMNGKERTLKRRSHEHVPLSFSQQRIWLLNQIEPETTAYTMPGTVRLLGKLDVAALERSMNTVIQRHESLRTIFTSHDGVPEQTIVPLSSFALQVCDLRQTAQSLREEVMRQRALEVARTPFDLEHGPLMRVLLFQMQDEEYVLLITLHHSIADGWSLGILVREISDFYKAGVQKQKLQCAPLSVQYADYAVWQRTEFPRDVEQEQLAYWRQQLGGELPQLALPHDGLLAADQRFEGHQLSGFLDKEMTTALKRLSQQEGVTLFMTLLATFQILLSRLSAQEDIIVGTPVAGRNLPELEDLIGCFVNTLALRSDLSGAPQFRELLQRVRKVVLGAQDHQDIPFEKVLEEIHPQRRLNHSPIFDVLLNFNTTPSLAFQLPDLTVSFLDILVPEAKFALTLYVEEQNEGLSLQLVYQRAHFSCERMTGLLDQYQYLLQQIVMDVERSIDDYTLVTPMMQRVLPDPHVELEEKPYELIHQVLSDVATRFPDQSAVRWLTQQRSYLQLMQRATDIGKMLVSQGIKRGDVVAVTGQVSFGLIASTIGVFMSGGVNLLIDNTLPIERQRVMFTEARMQKAILVGNEAERILHEASIDVLRVDAADATFQKELADVVDVQLPVVLPEDAAYIFFTSGTTGVPKGVLGSHKGLAHFLAWQRETFAVGTGDRAAQLTRLSFDVVLRDIFLPLTAGATLCLPETDAVLFPERLVDWLQREEITLLHTVPTLAQSWMNMVQGANLLPTLRLVFFAGEPLKETLIQRWRRTFGDRSKLINLYGPTETTLAKFYYIVPENVQPGVQPVGRPLPATQALVLRKSRQLCGPGEPGEIVIRTPFRSLGYINATGTDRERFQPNPYRADMHDQIYFTGDRGRYMVDGTLEIMGRFDDQTKVRGIRVELREIEVTLTSHPVIRDAVVVAREDGYGDTCLVAFVILAKHETLTATEMRIHIKERLPVAMVPAGFVALDKFPVTANGKVDKSRLPEVELTDLYQEQEFIAPMTPIEQELADIWSEVLHIGPISMHQNFFDLGGHSLLAAQMVARVRSVFRVELGLHALFNSPTIAGMARLVEEAMVSGVDDRELEELLAQLDTIEDIGTMVGG